MYLPSPQPLLCLLASLRDPGLSRRSIEGADTSHIFSSARLLQQPLKKSLPILRNMKCISSGPFVPPASDWAMTSTLSNSPLFSHAASKCNWRKKKFCTCPPISNQRFLSPVCRYNLSQMSANPKTDVFMVETYKSMAWATASFPGEKSYRYDLCFF